MSEYFRILCPQCAGRLRIRRVYLGRKVSCKLCEFSFKARDDHPESSDSGADFPSGLVQSLNTLSPTLDAVSAERDGIDAENAKLRGEIDEARRALDDLERRCETERRELEAAHASRCQAADAELSRLAAGLAGLCAASEAARVAFEAERAGLEGRLEQAQAEAEELRSLLRKANNERDAAATRFADSAAVEVEPTEPAGPADPVRSRMESRLDEANDRAARALAEAREAGEALTKLAAELDAARREQREVSAALDETNVFLSRMRSQLGGLGIFLPD